MCKYNKSWLVFWESMISRTFMDHVPGTDWHGKKAKKMSVSSSFFRRQSYWRFCSPCSIWAAKSYLIPFLRTKIAREWTPLPRVTENSTIRASWCFKCVAFPLPFCHSRMTLFEKLIRWSSHQQSLWLTQLLTLIASKSALFSDSRGGLRHPKIDFGPQNLATITSWNVRPNKMMY